MIDEHIHSFFVNKDDEVEDLRPYSFMTAKGMNEQVKQLLLRLPEEERDMIGREYAKGCCFSPYHSEYLFVRLYYFAPSPYNEHPLLGYCDIEKHRDEYYTRIAVDSQHRREGIGEKLLRAAIRAVPDGHDLRYFVSEKNVASYNLALKVENTGARDWMTLDNGEHWQRFYIRKSENL